MSEKLDELMFELEDCARNIGLVHSYERKYHEELRDAARAALRQYIAKAETDAHIEMRNFRKRLLDLSSALQEPAASQLLEILYPDVEHLPVAPLTVPRISKWFRGSPCAIVIEFAGDITNAQIEALPRALMDALASDRQVLHSYNAHCAYCEWSREDVDGLAEGKKLAAEHAKTCKWHPMNAPRVGQRPDLYALAKADAQDWGDALNEAGWRYAEAFREIIGEPTSAAHWNNGKRVLREALLAFFTRVEKSAAPEGDKHE